MLVRLSVDCVRWGCEWKFRVHQAADQGDAPQMSALWLAADKNDVTSVRRLLTAKCDPNQPEVSK
eukprot:5257421-Amphidinium_carterae.1